MIALETEKKNRLRNALLNNAQEDKVILMDSRTQFVGETDSLDENAEVVNAIKSVPMHY